MIDITNEIAAIQVATTGSDIRSAIVNALSVLNSEIPSFYSGAYIINPGSSDIVLSVSGKAMISDLTIRSYSGSGSGSAVLGTKTVSENGSYYAASDNFDGYSIFTVAVPYYSGAYDIIPGSSSQVLSVSGFLMSQDLIIEAEHSGGYSLPSEYQEVEYLGITGDQYCNIAFPLASKDVITGEFAQTSNTNAEGGMFGHSGAWEIYCTGSMFKTPYYTSPVQVIYEGLSSAASFKSLTLNSKTGFSFIVVTPSTASEFYVGVYRPGLYPFYGRIYNFGILRTMEYYPEPALWLVPCYRKSDSEPGFYDIVGSSFYSNVGSGTFSIGSEIN